MTSATWARGAAPGLGLVCFLVAAAARAQETADPTSAPAPAPVPAPAAAPVPAQPAPAAMGTVTGRVVDARGGAPLKDVFVGDKSGQFAANTDDDGRFSIELPAGTHELSLAFDLYQPQVLQNLVVTPGGTVAVPFVVRLRLLPRTGTVHVIREPDRNSAAAQVLIRQSSARVSDVVSAEDIKKSADSNSAQSAARVVGATVVGDRFVYVRGLGERYANALFNGAPLPSPEPDQQAVPFDIFPASLLANLTIAKTATPDLPADFAGGSVQITTREFTTRLSLSATAQLGANLATLSRPFLSYPGGRTDWLGIDDGSRAAPPIPTGLRGADGQLLSRTQVAELQRQLRNTWVPRRADRGPLDGAFSLALGDQTLVRGRPLGYLFSLSYNLTHTSRDEERHVYNLDAGALKAQTDLSGPVSQTEVQWGGLGHLSLQAAPGHRLSLAGIFTQNSEDEARLLSGFRAENNTQVWTTRLRFVQRTFGFVQLGGDHLLPARGKLLGGSLDWRLTYARASRSEPDTRETYYLAQPGGAYAFFNNGNSGQRFFSDNGEHQVAAGVNLTQGFHQWRRLAASFKVGALVRLRLRDFAARRFQLYSYGRDAAGRAIDRLPPEELFAPENISTQNGVGVELRDNTQPADRYRGQMGVYAAYALVDLPLHARVRLVTGLRFEAAQQTVDSLSFNGDPVHVALASYDALPSANLVYRVTDRMNLRAAVSLTVARPEFRELSPFQFTDFFGGETVRGNPDLQRTRIVNADLRWEWFLGEADLLAASVFYKRFDQPIESIIIPGGNLIRSFANAPAAYNLGAEVEGRKDLGVLTGALSGVSLGGNLSWIYSQVDLAGTDGVQTSKQRSLQGQSPYVVNAFLEYDRPAWGLQARALYNLFGPRIDSVGALGLPDKYQQPRHVLDLTVSQRLHRGLVLRLVGRNLLDAPVHITQSDQTVLLYRTGRSLNLSLVYNY